MKQIIFKIGLLTFSALVWIPTIVMAGPGFNTNVNDGGCDVPLDGGLTILAAAGIGYAARKVMRTVKQEKSAK